MKTMVVEQYELSVPGMPYPKMVAKQDVIPGKNYTIPRKNPEYEEYANRLTNAVNLFKMNNSISRPLHGLIGLKATFFYKRPLSHYDNRSGCLKDWARYIPHYTWPPAHMLGRGVIEALAGILFENTLSVAAGPFTKLWADSGPGSTEIVLERLILVSDDQPELDFGE